MEGLSKSVADLIVYEHPSQSKDVDKAILRELSSLLFKSVSLTFHFILNCRFLVLFLKGFFVFFADILRLSMELYWLTVLSLKINVREFSLGFTLILVSDYKQTC